MAGMRLRLVVPALVVAGLFVSRRAEAHPDFPSTVDTDLGLTGSVTVENVFPPSGCQLCHTSPGGATISLTPFGERLVIMYGVSSDVATDDPSEVTAALAAMQTQDPKLIEDLKNGKDPSADITSTVLMPVFGCSAAPGPAGGYGAALLVVAAALLRRGQGGARGRSATRIR
jgi:uncharacterized protein (TIGR03382 family)